MKLEDLTIYKITSELSIYVWNIIIKWDYFNKKVLGVQWIESIDSIGANIAEGFGRYHKKDKIKFYYNSRGSIYEAEYWTKKAIERKLISNNNYIYIINKLLILPKEINNLIKLTNNNLRK